MIYLAYKSVCLRVFFPYSLTLKKANNYQSSQVFYQPYFATDSSSRYTGIKSAAMLSQHFSFHLTLFFAIEIIILMNWRPDLVNQKQFATK